MEKIEVSYKEACEMLSISERTMRRMISGGTGPRFTSSKPYRFRVKELERWSMEQEVKACGKITSPFLPASH